MAYEFKKLSDVDVVAEPTESANVLIEENGVIKKAPKTAVGGSDGGGDFIINATPGEGNISMTPYTVMEIDKTFEEIVEAINGGQRVVLNFAVDGLHYVASLTFYSLEDYNKYIQFNSLRLTASGGVTTFEGYISYNGINYTNGYELAQRYVELME